MGYRSPQVCKRAGVTYRQLDYWVRTGVVTPSIVHAQGSGRQHRWSEADVERVRIINDLLNSGYSLQGARRLLAGVAS
jgi:DNA-binding transcriptional MerR regulator